MPVRKPLNPQLALDHLKKVYHDFLKLYPAPGNFTIAEYKKINTDKEFYIDVYVKKLGGWSSCLKKSGIPQRAKPYKDISRDQIGKHVLAVYKNFLRSKEENQTKNIRLSRTSFRMSDYTEANMRMKSSIPVAVVIQRFGSWTKLLEFIQIPVGRTRNLSNQDLMNHLQKVYLQFRKKNKTGVFSKEMYAKYNLKNDFSISSKLLERRFGSWSSAKKILKIN